MCYVFLLCLCVCFNLFVTIIFGSAFIFELYVIITVLCFCESALGDKRVCLSYMCCVFGLPCYLILCYSVLCCVCVALLLLFRTIILLCFQRLVFMLCLVGCVCVVLTSGTCMKPCYYLYDTVCCVFVVRFVCVNVRTCFDKSTCL